MENTTTTNRKVKQKSLVKNAGIWKGVALIAIAGLITNQVFEISITPKLGATDRATQSQNASTRVNTTVLAQEVVPADGIVLPITWNDLGKRMIADGVIDEVKFRSLFENNLTASEEKMLTGTMDEPIVLNQQNSRFLLDLFWAFGLANKNDILENGEMTDPKYGGDAGSFAATGGWTIAQGNGMDHYSMHNYVTLTADQQKSVDEVSRNIYRPCCGNSTHFPDCNHGMALLGLLQLLAADGATEEEMYQVSLAVNSYWFPQTYIDLATYFEEQGIAWKDVDPKVALSQQYSSAQGYQQTRQQIRSLPQTQQGGGGCGA